MRTTLAVLLPILLTAGCASSPPHSYLEVLEGATRVGCRGTDGSGPFGSRLARGPVVAAPSGGAVAWVEVEARALTDGGGEGTCQNVSRVWVRDGQGERVVFTQRPGWEGRNGNAIELVEWSPDGRLLLMELSTWTYPTEPPDPVLLVWDAEEGEVEQLRVEDAIAERFGEECAARARGEGFTAEGAVVVRIEPVPASIEPPCVERREGWVLRPGAYPILEPAEGAARARKE